MLPKVKITNIYYIKNYKILQNITKYYKILQNITKYYKILQNITKYYKILQNIYDKILFFIYFLTIITYNMSIDLQSFENDIINLTNNFSKFKLLILFVENKNLTSILKKKINVKNNYLSNKELIQYIQNIKELTNHKIQYLLDFTIEKSIDELEQLFNNKDLLFKSNNYELKPITNINSLNITINQKNQTFTNINTLIIIAKKIKVK
jgi:hypothetical protein